MGTILHRIARTSEGMLGKVEAKSSDYTEAVIAELATSCASNGLRPHSARSKEPWPCEEGATATRNAVSLLIHIDITAAPLKRLAS